MIALTESEKETETKHEKCEGGYRVIALMESEKETENRLTKHGKCETIYPLNVKRNVSGSPTRSTPEGSADIYIYIYIYIKNKIYIKQQKDAPRFTDHFAY